VQNPEEEDPDEADMEADPDEADMGEAPAEEGAPAEEDQDEEDPADEEDPGEEVLAGKEGQETKKQFHGSLKQNSGCKSITRRSQACTS
jgi:hypothetical protein